MNVCTLVMILKGERSVVPGGLRVTLITRQSLPIPRSLGEEAVLEPGLEGEMEREPGEV